MQKKYLKTVLTGLSVASLAAGMTGAAMAASGWGGSPKGAVGTQVEKEVVAPGYGAQAVKEAVTEEIKEEAKEAVEGGEQTGEKESAEEVKEEAK